MKTPAGVLFIATLLVVGGFHGLSDAGPTGPGRSVVLAQLGILTLGALSIMAGVALWQRRPTALGWYAAWAAASVLTGAGHEIVAEREPVLLVAAGSLLVALAWTAVGAYLRSALRGSERTAS